MNDTLILALVLVTGVVLGAMFFGSLWWTVHRGGSSKRSALWFFGSLLLRTSIALAGFYVVSSDHCERLLICLLGFVIAHLIAMVFTRGTEKPTYVTQKASDEP